MLLSVTRTRPALQRAALLASMVALVLTLLWSTSAGSRAADSPRLVKLDEIGWVRTTPNSDKPSGCLKSGKGVCTGAYTGTVTTSSLFAGSAAVAGTFTVDFTKPETSPGGVCFPLFVEGGARTAQGMYSYVEQRPLCIPAAAHSIPPRYDDSSGGMLFVGKTGAYAHLHASATITVSGDPTGLIILRILGVATGV